MDLPTHKIVNGEQVELTQDEIDAIVSEWNANEAAAYRIRAFNDYVAAGYPTPDGWYLPIDDESRRNLVDLRSQLLEGLSLGAWTDESTCPVALRDASGELHEMTVGDTRRLIFAAGNYYAALLNDSRS